MQPIRPFQGSQPPVPQHNPAPQTRQPRNSGQTGRPTDAQACNWWKQINAGLDTTPGTSREGNRLIDACVPHARSHADTLPSTSTAFQPAAGVSSTMGGSNVSAASRTAFPMGSLNCI